MGWSSGTDLMQLVIKAVRSGDFTFKQRKKLYQQLIDAFEAHDWDTQDECLGIEPAFDAAFYYLHPELKDDPDD